MLKNKKIIDNYFKKNKYVPLLDVLIDNIDNTTMYIRLDYVNASNTFRVSWVDLSLMKTKDPKQWVNTNLIFPNRVDKLKDIIALNGMSQDFVDNDEINSSVIINSYITNYEYNKKTFIFKRYIPSCWKFLADVLDIIFNAMPRFTYSFFQIMIEKIIEPIPNNYFAYDMKNDVKELFKDNDIKLGTKLYNDNKIINQEKFNKTLYTIVEDNKRYLNTIKYDDKNKEMIMLCNCNSKSFCKHLYASLMYYKDNNKEIRYYKLSFKSDKPLLDRIKDFEYFLCADIDGDDFICISDNQLIRLPILNKDSKEYIDIIEDDDSKTLTKKYKKYLKDKGIC